GSGFALTLDGWWMKRSIGNCIDLEDWIHFPGTESGQYSFTIIDRNACHHGRNRETGTGMFELDAGPIVQLTRTSPLVEKDRFTAAIFDPPAMFHPDPTLPKGYAQTGRELFDGAYLRLGDPLSYRRDEI